MSRARPGALPDVLAAHGVKYFDTCPNCMVGKPMLVAPPFWWGRGLVAVGCSCGRPTGGAGFYGAGHELGFPQGLAVAREKTLNYVKLLESEGYPYEVLCLHYAADNYPPDAGLPDLIGAWNEHGDLPSPTSVHQCRVSSAACSTSHGDQFPECALAWPDWWGPRGWARPPTNPPSPARHTAGMLRIEKLLEVGGEQRDLWPDLGGVAVVR